MPEMMDGMSMDLEQANMDKLQSVLGHILAEAPELRDYSSRLGSFIRYKGRSYAWTNISENGQIILIGETLAFFEDKGWNEAAVDSQQ